MTYKAHPLTFVVSFGGLFYLSIYLAAKLHVLDSKGEVWKSFVVLVPTLGAALIAGSRIMDARHHPFDVLSGSLMGILVAWGSYRQYFPPVSETWRKGRAYPIRAWGKGPDLPPPNADVADDIQPLRPVRSATDEERGTSSAIPEADAHSGNVFRQQIHQSQRRRQDEFGGIQPSDTMSSTYSTKVAGYQGQLPASNPFAGEGRRRRDNYEYSSSEDDDNIELQPAYSLSGRPLAGQHGANYDPVAGRLTDTGYHPPQGITPTPTPPPPRPTGDLGEARGAPPPPPAHAVGTAS
jgi:diacylglycerol diphosphate phosphatase/phosphatidate phosphatase